jgi:putative ABC transport system permease protein
MKGQLFAAATVMACGVAMLMVMRSLIRSLETARSSYYEQYRFAEVFCDVKRAPESLRSRLMEIDGVATVETRIAGKLTLDLPGVVEPADGLIFSLPDDRPQQLHLLFLRSGRLPEIERRGEVVIGEAFAQANGLQLGDAIGATLHGRRQRLTVCGIALSPEFVFEARPGDALPDNRRFGIFWMNERELAAAYDLDGAFNSVLIDAAPGASLPPLLAALDDVLAPYGGRIAYTRRDHASAVRLDDELRVLGGLAVAFPAVFLSIAAFMSSAVLSRLVRLQREQIAQLKALGYSSAQVGRHYLGFAAIIVVIGATLGLGGGCWLGSQTVEIYQKFFRFPSLVFLPDAGAMAVALIVSAGAAFIGAAGAVRAAVRLPPAEAMRPEPPAQFRPTWLERLVPPALAGPTMRMALRQIGRKPWASIFTAFGLALAAALPIVPGTMRDGINGILDHTFNRAQHQDATVVFTEPASPTAMSAVAHLPGVLTAEAFRGVPARLRFGNRSRRLEITGVSPEATLARRLDADARPVAVPPEGLIISAKLAEVLGAKPGDMLSIEVQEGERPTRDVVLAGLIEDYNGVAAYMDIDALHRLMRESDVFSGAYLSVDGARWKEFYDGVKKTPRIAALTLREAGRRSFRETTGDMIGKIQRIYFTFAAIIAFGVVYNSARIALSERGRELATLRVIGFTPREVATVLISELVFLTLSALPLGLLIGTGLARGIVTAASTESVRLPFLPSSVTYATATLIVTIASVISFAAVARRIGKLDLLGALKARD